MQGSIRFVLGLLITWAAAGSMDAATDTQLAVLVVIAVAGLGIMYSGARALQHNWYDYYHTPYTQTEGSAGCYVEHR